MVYPCNGILFGNKKGWATDTQNGKDECQNNFAEWKKSDKRIHIVSFNLYTRLVNTNQFKVKECRPEVSQKQWEREIGGRDQQEVAGNSLLLHMFFILIVVIFSQVYRYVKTFKLRHFPYTQFIVCWLCFTIKMLK